MAHITSAPDRENVTPGITWADRNPTTTAPTMQIPPMVGVPALAMWTWGPSSRICWPMLFLSSHRMSSGVVSTATHRAMPPEVMREIIGASDPNRSAKAAAPSTRSSNGHRDGTRRLGGLVTLAGQQHHVTGARLGHRQADGRRPVRLHDGPGPSRPFRPAPPR